MTPNFEEQPTSHQSLPGRPFRAIFVQKLQATARKPFFFWIYRTLAPFFPDDFVKWLCLGLSAAVLLGLFLYLVLDHWQCEPVGLTVVEKGVSLLASLLELFRVIMIYSTVSDAYNIVMSFSKHMGIAMAKKGECCC